MFNKTMSWGLASALALNSILLVGCAAGPARKIPVVYPRGEKFTIVAHEQSVPTWLLAINKLELNYIVRDDVTEEQLAAVAVTQDACRIYTDAVRPNVLVAVISNGIIYGISGYAGLYYGSQALKGTHSSEYGKYGGRAGFASGLANGIVSEGGKKYTFQSCSKEMLGKVQQYGITVITDSPY